MNAAGYTTTPAEVAEAFAVYRCFQALDRTRRPHNSKDSDYRQGHTDGRNSILMQLHDAPRIEAT